MFLWDDANIEHIARHGVLPEEAEQVLNNEPLDIDDQWVNGERRWVHLGETYALRLLLVVVTFHNEDIRVVTAYEPMPRWRRLYYREKGYKP